MRRSRIVKRGYRRVSPPAWPFVFRGLVPVVGLVAVALFGVLRFAGQWIERPVQENIRLALGDAGHDWADAQVSGQQVTLMGSAPSSSAFEDALRLARETTCPTWLGPQVCAVSVSGTFAPSDPPDVPAPAAEPTEPETAAAASQCEESIATLLTGERIGFASGSATLAESAAPLLDRIAGVAVTCPGVLRIEGHTDSTGDRAANQALSAARAEAVRAALGSRGVDLDRLVAVGYGPDRPIAGNDTAEGRARNRRIEFRVVQETN